MPKNEPIMLGGARHVVMECGTCGVFHTIPEVKYDTCRREGGFWTCPNGHSRGWDKGAEHTEIADLRRERDRLKQDASRLQDEISAQARRAESAERNAARLKKRAANGVCPCCTRAFGNLARHMKTKHPEFKAEETNVVPLKSAS